MQIDSYVAERRSRRKKRYRYFWSVAIFLAVYFVFLGIAFFFIRLQAFQAQRIVIQGNNTVSDADIMSLLQASLIRKGDSFTAPNNGFKALLGFENMLIWPSALPSSTLAVLPRLADMSITKNYFLHTINVSVSEREPFAVWCSAGEASSTDEHCYWFDNQGVAFEQGLDMEGGSLMVIHDYSGRQIVIGGNVLPAIFLPNLTSILNVLQQSGANVGQIALNDLALQQIDVTLANGPVLHFSLRFSADEDLPVLENLMTQPGFDKLEYIDFTVQNRAYYK